TEKAQKIYQLSPNTPIFTPVLTTPPQTAAIPDFWTVGGERHAYATDMATNKVLAFTINHGNGHLSSISQYNAGQSPISVAMGPRGRYLYVLNQDDSSISEYLIGTDGTLTQIGTKPVGTATQPMQIIANPHAPYLYVAVHDQQQVWSYRIQPSGGLLKVASVTVSAAPTNLTTDRNGQYLYVAYGLTSTAVSGSGSRAITMLPLNQGSFGATVNSSAMDSAAVALA